MVLDILDFFNPDIQNEKPEKIISHVLFNMSRLVEDHIKFDTPGVVYRIGRKSLHLLNRYETNISEKGFLLGYFGRIRGDIIQKKVQKIPKKMVVYIFTDSIHLGNEMKFMLDHFKKSGTKINKIFCYLENEEGVNNLINNRLIKRKQIFGKFTSKSEEQYEKEGQKLQIFFRSRIEPMEIDTNYDKFMIDAKLMSKDINDINNIIKSELNIKSNLKSDNKKSLPKNIKEIHFLKEDLSNINFNDILPACNYQDFKIDSILIRLKINNQKIYTEFTISIITNFDMIPDNIQNIKVKKINNCKINEISYAKDIKNEVPILVCPICIERNIANNFLDKIRLKVYDYLISKGYPVISSNFRS